LSLNHENVKLTHRLSNYGEHTGKASLYACPVLNFFPRQSLLAVGEEWTYI